MAVEFDIVFEQDPVIELDLGVLQLIGFADHALLKNRELADQHPTSAITGLDDELTEIAQCMAALGEQGKTLVDAVAALQERQNTFEVATQQAIKELAERLTAEETATAVLQAFAENIATGATVKEVLNNG